MYCVVYTYSQLHILLECLFSYLCALYIHVLCYEIHNKKAYVCYVFTKSIATSCV